MPSNEETADRRKDDLAASIPSMPTTRTMRNRRGDVVLQLHASAWMSPAVQRLSMLGRAVLTEILMQFACGYRQVNIRSLAAMCNMKVNALEEILSELVEGGMAVVTGNVVTLIPAVTKRLVLGQAAE
jgi:hypothetical protein